MSDVMQNGIDMVYEYGGEAYGALTETFWTANRFV